MGLRRKATKLLTGVEHNMGCHAKSWDYRDTCSIDCKRKCHQTNHSSERGAIVQ